MLADPAAVVMDTLAEAPAKRGYKNTGGAAARCVGAALPTQGLQIVKIQNLHNGNWPPRGCSQQRTRVEPQQALQAVGVGQVTRDASGRGRRAHRLPKPGRLGRHAQRRHKVHAALGEVRPCS